MPEHAQKLLASYEFRPFFIVVVGCGVGRFEHGNKACGRNHQSKCGFFRATPERLSVCTNIKNALQENRLQQNCIAPRNA
eukprot:3960574-Pleurochrysis_carterae.AAC.10